MTHVCGCGRSTSSVRRWGCPLMWNTRRVSWMQATSEFTSPCSSTQLAPSLPPAEGDGDQPSCHHTPNSPASLLVKKKSMKVLKRYWRNVLTFFIERHVWNNLKSCLSRKTFCELIRIRNILFFLNRFTTWLNLACPKFHSLNSLIRTIILRSDWLLETSTI